MYRVLNSNMERVDGGTWDCMDCLSLHDAYVRAMSLANENEETYYVARVTVEVIDQVDPEEKK
jgi:hypothetical protein